MANKTEWEKRIGMLLDARKQADFVYSYKPIDGMHGGQPKVDWFACDRNGWMWMIEVKSLPENRQSINLMGEVTAGQRQALDAVAASHNGVALLVVGQGNALHFFDWRDIGWLAHERPGSPLLPLDPSFLTLIWTGPKGWTHRLHMLLGDKHLGSAPILVKPSGPSRKPIPLPSTSKPKVSIPMPRMMRPSAQSSSKPARKGSS
jgi:hypothetical protein